MRIDTNGKKVQHTMLCAAVAGLLLAVATPAAAWDDYGWGGGYGYSDYGYFDAQDSRESAEESARESAREKRRDEVEAKKAQDSAEHAAYTDSIMAASQASVQAPRGVYYRKPGFISGEGPGEGAQVIEESGVKLFVDQGVCWVKQGTQYVVVAAPYGIVVDKLPPATTKVATKTGAEFGYWFGTFYQRKGDKFVVVKPPAGLNVTYLPDGYQKQEGKDGSATFKFGDTVFKQVMVLGIPAYQVVG
jgi:hypothetical protein